MSAAKLIPKVKSLGDLFQRSKTDPRYARLTLLAASNLGGNGKTLAEAERWLLVNAQETDEDGVVGEINYVRDLVTR